MTSTAVPRSRKRWRSARFGLAFVTPYLVFLIAIGLVPVGTAIYESFIDRRGMTGAFGLQNFVFVFNDFRFWPAVLHVAGFMILWIPIMVVGTLVFALMLHERVGRATGALRLVYYLPGAVAGSAAVMLWSFMLTPQISPFGPVLEALGFHTVVDLFTESRLAAVFAFMAFVTGVGSWIVIMFGAFQSLPPELLEAARCDGAGPLRIAWSIKLPLVRKYILYMVILSFAAASQVFVEPALINSILPGAASPWWSLNQLGTMYAFQEADSGSAAVISLMLLVLSLIAAAIIILKTDIFQTEVDSK